jgi:hypothetical protein
MSDHEEERRVKIMHDVTQFYQQRGIKRTTSQQDLPRGDMTISGDIIPNANSSSDNDVEDETYVSSPQARPHGKGLTSASGSGAARNDEIEEEYDGNDRAVGDNDEEHEEVFDVEEINPTSYIHMRTLVFRLPLNPDWRGNWNNEIIAQLFATLYVEERGDTRKFHLMTEGRRYEITFEQFARLFGFG